MGKNILFHLDNQVQPWIVLWIFFFPFIPSKYYVLQWNSSIIFKGSGLT